MGTVEKLKCLSADQLKAKAPGAIIGWDVLVLEQTS